MRTPGRNTRVAAIALAFPVVAFAANVAVATEVAEEDFDGLAAAVILLPIAAFGAVVGRWWTLGLPLVWSAVVLGVVRLIDLESGRCSICTHDEGWHLFPYLVLVFEVIPMTGALLAGVGARAALRRLRPRAARAQR